MTTDGEQYDLPPESCILPGARVTLAFLASILDHVAHPIFVKDREYRFVVLNRAIVDMLGIPRAAMLGRTDYDFFPRAESDYFRARDTEMFERGEVVRIEEESLTDGAGGRHVLATTKVPLRDARGEVTHLVGIIHDITALKRAEDALRDVNEALEVRVRERTAALETAQAELMRRERLAVVGQLAGAIAHQIRNPLGSIKNAAYLMQLASAPGTDPDVTRALSIIHDEVHKANQIITDLLDYARILPPSVRAVPMAYLIELALGGLPPHEHIRVHRDFSDAHVVRCDPDQLQSAVFNLLRNALEAMPDGGDLTLAVRDEGERCRVEITDTGPGLPEALREQILDPLGHHGRAMSPGLHLMTARALVENQGGTFEFESGPERGTRFVLRLLKA